MGSVTLFSKRDIDLIKEGIYKVIKEREHTIAFLEVKEKLHNDSNTNEVHILNKDIAYLRLLILKIEKYLK